MEIQTITKPSHNVVVVGGGIAGVCAAVAAARRGASVLLIEKSINLGGLATRGLISWYEPLCDGEGHKMIGGLAEELIRLCTKVGLDDLSPAWGGIDRQKSNPHKRYCTHFSPTFFSLALDRWVLDAGVELVLDSYATYPVMEAGRLQGVLVEEAAGRCFYPAEMVIDASNRIPFTCLGRYALIQAAPVQVCPAAYQQHSFAFKFVFHSLCFYASGSRFIHGANVFLLSVSSSLSFFVPLAIMLQELVHMSTPLAVVTKPSPASPPQYFTESGEPAAIRYSCVICAFSTLQSVNASAIMAAITVQPSLPFLAIGPTAAAPLPDATVHAPAPNAQLPLAVA